LVTYAYAPGYSKKVCTASRLRPAELTESTCGLKEGIDEIVRHTIVGAAVMFIYTRSLLQRESYLPDLRVQKAIYAIYLSQDSRIYNQIQ
jgi:hypothetical protein